MYAHEKSLAQRDFVLSLVVASCRFTLRTPHQERTRRYPGKLHPQAVRDDFPWFSLQLRRMGLLPLFLHFLDDLLGSFLVKLMQLAHLVGGSRVVLRRVATCPVQGFTDQ